MLTDSYRTGGDVVTIIMLWMMIDLCEEIDACPATTSLSPKRRTCFLGRFYWTLFCPALSGPDHHRPGSWLDRLLKRLKGGLVRYPRHRENVIFFSIFLDNDSHYLYNQKIYYKFLGRGREMRKAQSSSFSGLDCAFLFPDT